uniref:Uncharacterized protein n=1 Tax=Rhizophora mucronata TaxID=61149 RepID=A0A2P2Q333_RHIMU
MKFIKYQLSPTYYPSVPTSHCQCRLIMVTEFCFC